MEYIFNGCSSLANLRYNKNLFKTNLVNDMSNMFAYCEKLTSIDVSGFDTNNVTNMNSMFKNCKEIKILDIKNFVTSNVTNMGHLFESCRNMLTLEFDIISSQKMSKIWNICLVNAKN